MIVYADREEVADTQRFLSQVIAATDPLERFIRLGQFEAGVVDALCPRQDDLHPTAARIREIALSDSPVEVLRSLPLPANISIRPPEGYAYYSLYPMQYELAARRFAAERGPRSCVVLGIRSIGTSLSVTVARELLRCGSKVWSWTVRPHGHPFDRKLVLSDRMASKLHQHLGDWFCIVDEGPGLSGSSFASVAEALSGLGVSDDRIVFFSGHKPDAESLLSETARDRWSRHSVYVEPFLESTLIPSGARDLSGGLWRGVTGCQVPVHPQHERRKYLHGDKLWKFAGLAHFGRARYERGRRLCDAGFIPEVLEFCDGFVVSRFMREPTASTGELLDSIARYLVFLRNEFTTEQRVRYAEIAEMVRVNTGFELTERNPVIEEGAVIALDGRMLPHEWIGTFKTDSLDHYDDHFFPGYQDIAWDIAGAAVEFGVPEHAIVDRYLALQPDRTLRRRMSFYRTAYLAYRTGYTDMASRTAINASDRREFVLLKNRYTAALAGTVGSSSSIA